MYKPVYNPFSRYADRHEKKVDKLLNKLAYKDRYYVRKKLLALMQENLVALNLWLEKRFKGYKYLNRFKRAALYRNTEKMIRIFEKEQLRSPIPDNIVSDRLREISPSADPEAKNKLKYILAIMGFLRPGKHYEYLEATSFGKLLANPEKGKMIGDCNQIVTLYVFLYSLKYPIKDLKIKLLPNHVCLHFFGIDLEATNASLQKYTDFTHLLPITELISTNLLDIADIRDKTIRVEARSFVKAAKLAVEISSIKDITEKNLNVAYYNLVTESLHNNDFETAEFYLQKIHDPKLEQTVSHNATLYYTEQKNYAKAKSFARKNGDKKLMEYVQNQEGWYYYQKNDTTHALEIFRNIPNNEMVKACYAKMYNSLQQKTSADRTISEQKSHKNEYRKMLDLARKMNDQSLAENLSKLLDSIS